MIFSIVIILLHSCDEKGFEALKVEEIYNEKDEIVCLIDPMHYPQFPGGDMEMQEFIKDNLVVPPLCAEGKVFVQFVVEKDGAISEVQVVRGMRKEHDTEAIKLVQSFPAFNPGSLNGVVMRTKMVLPVNFTLQ